MSDPHSGNVPPGKRRQLSLRRRLLLFLLVPTFLLMLLATGLLYFVALRYSNGIHDEDLQISTLGLAKALQDGHSGGHLTQEAYRLLEFNPTGRNFFSVVSARHGFISGSERRMPLSRPPPIGNTPVLSDMSINGLPVRVASVTIISPAEAGDRLTVSLAESLNDRQQQAKEILLLTIPIESALIVVLLALVWKGIQFGLRVLDTPIQRLAQRERALEPISGPDIPIEILPLTRTIDALFARIQTLVAVQERFVADAAHQLRTPLTGLAMHVERASAARSERDVAVAMTHIKALVGRVTRSATQLLALARVQARERRNLAPIDLAQWLPRVTATRIPESLQAGVDLGYESAVASAVINADADALQELFDNLVDNALAHAPPGGLVTVSLQVSGADGVLVAVDDAGSGVSDDILPRLGERFFRAPGAPDGGSGLGLAIVQRIADAHDAQLRFMHSQLGGLRVEIRFPKLHPLSAGP